MGSYVRSAGATVANIAAMEATLPLADIIAPPHFDKDNVTHELPKVK